MEPEQIPTEPSFLFSVDTLLTEQEKLLQKESEDRTAVSIIDNPNLTELGVKLREWATRGFADAFAIFSVQVNPPEVCSDGVTRNFLQYIDFLCGEPVSARILRLQSKLQGMVITCSYSVGNDMTFHVSKA